MTDTVIDARTLPPWPEAEPDVLQPVEEHDDLRAVTRSILERGGSIERVREVVEHPTGYSADLWTLLASEVGVAALAVPESRGGLGYGVREVGIVLEECGAALTPEPVLASAVLGTQALLQADDPDEVGELLAAALVGKRVLSVAVAGDLAVTRDGTGWRVDGSLRRVLQGAATGVVVARATHDGAPVLVAVDVPDGAALECTVLDPTRRQADLRLEAAAARVVVGPDRFEAAWSRLETLRRVAVACEHAGLVGHLLDLTVAYVVERQQFGRTIGSFQAVKHRLADVLVDRERARSAARYAAAVYATDPEAARLPAAVAAAVCLDAAVRTAHEAVQLHGGIGFTWEHQAHLYLRRVLGDEGLFGSSTEHRRLVADLVGLGTREPARRD